MAAATLTPTINPVGSGSVTITLQSTWSDSHRTYKSYLIKATAAAGFRFLRFEYTYTYEDLWNGGTFTDGGTITASSFNFDECVDGDTFNHYGNQTLASVTAYFEQITTFTISVSATTGGSVSGGGTYAQGASCTVVATPNAGYRFNGWYENAQNVSNNSNYTFAVYSNRTLIADFVPSPSPTQYRTISAESKQYGVDPITQQPLRPCGDIQINSRTRAKTDSASLQASSTCTLTAYPANTPDGSPYHFLRWVRTSPASPAKQDTRNPLSFEVGSDDETWVAEFGVQIDLTVSPPGSGTASMTPPGPIIEYNSQYSLSAAPIGRHQFDHWHLGGQYGPDYTTPNLGPYTANFNESWTAYFTELFTHLLVNSSDRLVPAMLVYDPTTNLLVADY